MLLQASVFVGFLAFDVLDTGFGRSDPDRRLEQLRPVAVQSERERAAQVDMLHGMRRDMGQKLGLIELAIVIDLALHTVRVERHHDVCQ